MKNKLINPLPRRQRRAPFLLKDSPTYFLTFCTANRVKSLANNDLFTRACLFIEKGNLETGFFITAIMIMPDHVHALVSINPHTKQKIGNWVRAFKRTVGKNDIHWQEGFFDHILRNSESHSEKWEYIRNNPVRAGLVQLPEQWPYQQWFHPATGELYSPDRDVRPTNILPNKPVGPTSLSGEKSDLRKIITARRPDFQCLENLSQAIVEKFQGLELFREAKTVGAYMPLPDEVDIRLLFGSAGGLRGRHSPGLPFGSESLGRANSPSEPEKTFYIPAFDETSGGYRLAEYTGEFKTGKFGIPEPAEPVFAPAALDLIIVPGIAFDRTGNRIGRGGGFYDRLLPNYRAIRAGVCFGFQCLEKVPAEPHDCTVDRLITETQILKFATNC